MHKNRKRAANSLFREFMKMMANELNEGQSANPLSSDKELFTQAEVAQMLGVSRSCVWKWQHEGRLKPTRISEHVVRYRREDIDALLFGNKNVEQSN